MGDLGDVVNRCVDRGEPGTAFLCEAMPTPSVLNEPFASGRRYDFLGSFGR